MHWTRVEVSLLEEFLHYRIPKGNGVKDTWGKIAERMNDAVRDRGLQCRNFGGVMIQSRAKKFYRHKMGGIFKFSEDERGLLREVVQSTLPSPVASEPAGIGWKEVASQLNQITHSRGLACRYFSQGSARDICHEVTRLMSFPEPGQPRGVLQSFEIQQPLTQSSNPQQLSRPPQEREQCLFHGDFEFVENQETARNKKFPELHQSGIHNEYPVGLGSGFEWAGSVENRELLRGWQGFMESEHTLDWDLPINWEILLELPEILEESETFTSH